MLQIVCFECEIFGMCVVASQTIFSALKLYTSDHGKYMLWENGNLDAILLNKRFF